MTNSDCSNESKIAIYLGLGSNIGDREANLHEATARIEAFGLQIASESSIYETEPLGYKDQRWFLNKVLKARPTPMLTLSDDGELTALLTKGLAETPERFAPFWALELLKTLLNIERDMGRERTVANGPRVIDIDLLLCGDLITEGFIAQSSEKMAGADPLAGALTLTLPHPRMHLRRFVLEPLCEIAPELVHPVLNKTCRAMLASLDDSSVVRLYKLTDY